MKEPKKIYIDDNIDTSHTYFIASNSQYRRTKLTYHSDTAIKEWIEENKQKWPSDGIIFVDVDELLKFLNE